MKKHWLWIMIFALFFIFTYTPESSQTASKRANEPEHY